MSEEHTPYRRASVEEVRKLLDEGYDLVDVREEAEWNRGHIPGARRVSFTSLIANPRQHRFQDRTMFVCEVGERSAVAAEMAVALGVKDVANLSGGTRAWRKAGLPVEVPVEAPQS